MKTERGDARGRRGVPGAVCMSVLLAALWVGQPGAGPAQASDPRVPDNRDVKLDPEDSVPPFYRHTLDERDRQRFDAAREAGETYLPTFQGPSTAAGILGPGGAATPAPERPQPVYEGYRRPEGRAEPAPGGDPLPAGAYIDVLIEAWTRQPAIVRVRYPEAASSDPGPGSQGGVSARPSGRDARTRVPPLPHVPAGTGLYARTMYAVDSDYPGPVLLEILEPPLAGAVASGGFTLAGERLTLRLNRLEHRGRSLAVDAWAAGLDCACYGVNGEVDRHWFERMLLPASVRFAEGFLTALSRPRETVIVGGDLRYERFDASSREAVHAGLATAAGTAGDVLLENAPDGPSVRIGRDTELVVVFAAAPGVREEAGDD